MPDLTLAELKREFDNFRSDLDQRPVQLPKQLDPASLAVLDDVVAIHYTETVPSYTPNKNGVREIYKDGSGNYWYYVYANGGWRRVKFAEPPAATPAPNAVIVTRGGNDASGDQTIAHGHGGTPDYIRITAAWGAGTPVLLQSFGTYNGTNTRTIMTWTLVGTGGGADNDSTNIVNISTHGGDTQVATVSSLNGTNLVLSWTKAGALGGTISLLVESFSV